MLRLKLNFYLFSFIVSSFVIMTVACYKPKTKDDNTNTPPLVSGLTVDVMTDSISLFPNQALLWYKRGVLYYETGDQTMAIRDFDQTIALDSNYTSAWHDRAICYFELDRFDSALSGFTKTIELDNTFYEAYFNRALVYEQMGKIQEAVTDYDQCIALNSSFAPAYYNRAVHLYAKNRSSACKDFKKAAELGDKDAENAYIEHCK
ncbi:MAG: tetratricopeptide repeat protein [Flavobacteriales bacterium]|nr:tetratricopeptide repeat protein [Flavobacteriales bacterium]